MNDLQAETAEFLALYDAQCPRLLAFFVRRVFDPEVAADLAAETFATALEQRNAFDSSRGDPVGWLFGIGRNLMFRYFRRRDVELRAVDRLGMNRPVLTESDIEWLEQRMDFEAQSSALAESIERLSSRQQQLLHLRFVESLPYREIAGRLQCSEESCRTEVSRTLRRLALELTQDDAEDRDHELQ